MFFSLPPGLAPPLRDHPTLLHLRIRKLHLQLPQFIDPLRLLSQVISPVICSVHLKYLQLLFHRIEFYLHMRYTFVRSPTSIFKPSNTSLSKTAFSNANFVATFSQIIFSHAPSSDSSS